MRIPLLRRLPRTPVIIIATAASTAVLVTATSAAAVTYYVKLNQVNYGTAQTTIKNANGTPLGLYAKSGYAPLYVNSTKAVARLNADFLDGHHGSWYAKVNAKTGIVPARDNGAKCPTGTIATGGGGDVYRINGDQTTTDIPVYYSGPDYTDTGALIPDSWLVLPDEAGLKDPSVHLDSYVVCYNPTGGSIPGSVTTLSAISPTKAALVKARAARR
jgi:hypothetical protein